MLPLLLLAFIVVPLAELYVIIQVGQWIGVLPTIGVLLLDSVVGTALLRSQGRLAWRRFTEATHAGRPPAREVIDGALVLLGGAFLLTPGFLTDVLGLALLVPPSRALIRRLLARRLAHRMIVSLTTPPPRGPAARPGTRDAGPDVEGTAVDLDPRRIGPRP